MATEWHYSRDNVKFGPVSTAQLKELVLLGTVRPTDLVWREGLAKWTPAAKVVGLFPSQSSAPPPLPAGAATLASAPPLLPSVGIKSAGTDLRHDGWKAVIARRKPQIVVIENAQGFGTGLLISSDGLIITNKHVVDGSDYAQVSFANNTQAKGAVLHRHPTADLAVVKVAVRSSEYLDLQKEGSEAIEAGDPVIAIGHPHGLRFTSTQGIVSVAKQRFGQEYYLQHDVAINPGNSGGPLLDSVGRLVGINTLLRKESQGLGFAIPTSTVTTYVNQVNAAVVAGNLRVPSDDEISDGHTNTAPEDALYAAVRCFEGTKEVVEEGGYLIKLPEGYVLGVWIHELVVGCMSQVAELGTSAKQDAALLWQLLELNHQLTQTKFSIDSNSVLWVVARRYVEGLGVEEAYSLIESVADTVVKYQGIVENYLAINHPSSKRDERSNRNRRS